MAISVSNVQAAENASSHATLTISSYAVGAVTNPVLVVCTAIYDVGGQSDKYDDVTFDGTSLVERVSLMSEGELGVAIWSGAVTASTTADIVATATGANVDDGAITAFVLDEATAVPLDTDTTEVLNTATGSNSCVVTPGEANSLVVGCAVQEDNVGFDAWTGTTTPTEHADNVVMATLTVGVATMAGGSGGAVTITANWTGIASIAEVVHAAAVFGFNPAVVSGGGAALFLA